MELGLDKSELVLGRCLKSPFKDKMAPSIISTEEKQLAFGLCLFLNVPLFSHALSHSLSLGFSFTFFLSPSPSLSFFLSLFLFLRFPLSIWLSSVCKRRKASRVDPVFCRNKVEVEVVESTKKKSLVVKNNFLTREEIAEARTYVHSENELLKEPT